jgi:hypothetical protein
MWHAPTHLYDVQHRPGVKQPEPEANHHLVLSSCLSRVAPGCVPAGFSCAAVRTADLRSELHSFALLLLLLNNGAL